MLPRALAAFPLFICILLHQISLGWAVAVNRTIDDSRGDSVSGRLPVYIPLAGPGMWKDQTCSDCRINPNNDLAFQRTHTSATRNPGRPKISITMEFPGTAIYVFFILANDAGPGITSNTDCNFILDNERPVHFVHNPDMSTKDLRYNQLVYSRQGLPFGNHRLEISSDGDVSSYINFDYAIYTFDDPSTSTTSSTTTSTSTTSESSTSSPQQTGSTPETTSKNSETTTKYLDGAPQNDNTPQTADPASTDTSTIGNTTSATSEGAPIGAIIGAVVGGLAALVLILLLVVCLRRRKRERLLLEAAAVMDYAPSAQHSTYGGGLAPARQQQDVYRYAQGPGGGSSVYHPEVASTAFGTGSVSTDRLMPTPNRRTSLQSSSAFTDTTSYSNAYGGIEASDIHPPPAFSGGTAGYPPDVKNPHLFHDQAPAGAGGYVAENGAPLREGQDAVRRARQAEIRSRLQEIEREMSELNRGIQRQATLRQNQRSANPPADYGDPFAPETSANGGRGPDSLEGMKEQMRQMQQEIYLLRQNQTSEWARGLTHEPPPGYTPSTRAGF